MGTIRVVLDSTNSIVSANDYNAWGFPLEGRSYELLNPVDQKYQFTGKERDKESGLGMNDGYDYFGARYYDSRIGRWGQVEPLLDKYVGVTPYCYSLCNPVFLKDEDGKDASVTIDAQNKQINISMTFYYASDNTDIGKEIKDAQNEWNNAGKSVLVNGEKFSVNFEF